ncbi:adenosine-specific kinase [Candidatus Hecatella orcuttiae]|uniref:adenosine-specific kinase n=1 Tax=Candidatus Hecatella orcuttiae TaxID=1935119 RepID=UPI0028681C25|nr:adenosine-specific kinase [Candidatus Hecatella orcuttiae]
MKTEIVKIETPEGCNLILGMAHFIKTVEDLYEAVVNSAPKAKFGVGFCESSGPCLVRSEGNDASLKKAAAENAFKLAAGHSFLIFLKEAYPINVLNAIKGVSEVCSIFCATANPVEVIVAETEQGRGILGVVDGYKSKGIEQKEDAEARKKFLRTLGYKL